MTARRRAPAAVGRRTRADVAAAVAIGLAVVLAATALWWTSDARGTTLTPAASPVPAPPGATAVPEQLREAWRAESPATDRPVVAGGVVATGDGGTVAGRDPLTGTVLWSYARDLPLCTATAAFDRVLAVHRRDDTCSEVTTLDPADGRRARQRSGPAGDGAALVTAPGHVVATDGRYLEAWRSDLVRTLAYGALPTPVRPGAQPRPDCEHRSAAVAAAKLAVVERCPGEPDDRITVQDVDPDESDQPEIAFSTLVPGDGAQVVAVTAERTAVALPDPPRLRVLDASGGEVAEHPLDGVALDTGARAAAVVTTPGALAWTTGSAAGAATVGLDPVELRPLWTSPDPLGPGAVVAGRLVVPVADGLAVLDPTTGARTGTIPVDRGGPPGPVSVAALGDVLVEQRGDVLVALR